MITLFLDENLYPASYLTEIIMYHCLITFMLDSYDNSAFGWKVVAENVKNSPILVTLESRPNKLAPTFESIIQSES